MFVDALKQGTEFDGLDDYQFVLESLLEDFSGPLKQSILEELKFVVISKSMASQHLCIQWLSNDILPQIYKIA